MKTLLSSDFAESVSVPAKRPKTQKAVSLEAAVPSTSDAYYDSDEETDEVFFSKNVHALSDEVEHEYKEIKVTKTAFSTYRAVLAYLRTGHIAFAPLTSKCGIEVVDDEEETPSRRAQVELAAGEHPNRPYLVSPKSVYRLAHLLDLQNLQASCITILREGGLTETSAPVELFDETCMLHEPWRNVVVDYIARHWAGVKQTAAWKDVEKKLDADEIPGAMPIMMQLFKAREKFIGLGEDPAADEGRSLAPHTTSLDSLLHAMAQQTASVFRPDLMKGKVAFVTGGGSGICYGITKQLMAHGANAAIFGRRKANVESAAQELSKETGSKCIGISGDVRKIETLEAAVKQTIEEFGRIDFVIAGAAGNFLAPLDGLSSNAFRTVLEIDTLGTFNTFKSTIDELVKTKGSLIAISATLHYTGMPLQAHVSAAKAGVDAFIRAVAVEYGPRGVRANCIAPGPIAGTEGMDRLMPKELVDKHTSMIPLQRYGSIDDIAWTALFLFSPAASYVTGTVSIVDGGDWHMSGAIGGAPYPDAFSGAGEAPTSKL
uniref:2,4-dienoyl-CoA reductase [(3E)-enoyl-CoA-producing] n=2 Tax=Rhodotorula toruloides TaxID=5286 RepID=A0A0K3CFX8_RHOTO